MSRIEPKEFVLKNGRKGVIRHAEKSDADSLLKLFDTIIAYDEYNVTTVADVEKLDMTVEKEEKYIEDHSKDGNLLLLAETDKRIIGMVGIENGGRQRTAHIGTLHINVDSEYRRNGIATKLLKTALEWAKDDQLIEKIELEVFANHTGAITLYKNFGFIEEGRKVKEIKISDDNYVDSVLMYKFVE
jgi:RimJ/RimL family protein N-acetyltransferase